MLSKSKFLVGMKCLKGLWLLERQKPVISKTKQHKFDTGNSVGELATELFDGKHISTIGFSENIELTKKHLGSTLFEAGFLAGELCARVDILKLNDDGSYDIIEVKSGTNVKDENILDITFQKHVCEKAGIKIARCRLCHLNNQYIRQGEIDPKGLFIIEDVTDSLQPNILEAIPEYIRTLQQPSCPDVKIGPHCYSPYECDFIDTCWKFLPKHNVFDLTNGRQKPYGLLDMGIMTLKDIPASFSLTAKQEIQRQCAITGKPHIEKEAISAFLKTLIYPISYLDFETFSPAVPLFDGTRPYQQIPFQYSLHIDDGNITHRSFLASTELIDPRPAFVARLKEHLPETGSILVYNQTFEILRLRELADAYPEYADWIHNNVIPRIIDLIIPFRNFSYYHPDQHGSCGLKSVLPALTGMTYEGMDIANGSDASMTFEQLLTGVITDADEIQKIRVDLERYCELDTMAEVEIVRKLKNLIN